MSCTCIASEEYATEAINIWRLNWTCIKWDIHLLMIQPLCFTPMMRTPELRACLSHEISSNGYVNNLCTFGVEVPSTCSRVSGCFSWASCFLSSLPGWQRIRFRSPLRSSGGIYTRRVRRQLFSCQLGPTSEEETLS